MVIIFSRNWRIEAKDGNNFVVQTRATVTREEGGKQIVETKWKTLGYYPRLSLAIRRVAEGGVHSAEGQTNLQDFAARFETWLKHIEQVTDYAVSRLQASRFQETIGDQWEHFEEMTDESES